MVARSVPVRSSRWAQCCAKAWQPRRSTAEGSCSRAFRRLAESSCAPVCPCPVRSRRCVVTHNRPPRAAFTVQVGFLLTLADLVGNRLQLGGHLRGRQLAKAAAPLMSRSPSASNSPLWSNGKSPRAHSACNVSLGAGASREKRAGCEYYSPSLELGQNGALSLTSAETPHVTVRPNPCCTHVCAHSRHTARGCPARGCALPAGAAACRHASCLPVAVPAAAWALRARARRAPRHTSPMSRARALG